MVTKITNRHSVPGALRADSTSPADTRGRASLATAADAFQRGNGKPSLLSKLRDALLGRKAGATPASPRDQATLRRLGDATRSTGAHGQTPTATAAVERAAVAGAQGTAANPARNEGDLPKRALRPRRRQLGAHGARHGANAANAANAAPGNAGGGGARGKGIGKGSDE